jgi:hypothetical protein
MIANCAAASTTHILHIGKATEEKKLQDTEKM